MPTREEFIRLCELAKLKIPEDKFDEINQDIDNILAMASVITHMPIPSDLPEEEVPYFTDMLREDAVKPSYDVEDIVKNAPGRKDDFFYIRRGN